MSEFEIEVVVAVVVLAFQPDLLGIRLLQALEDGRFSQFLENRGDHPDSRYPMTSQ
jgi:hypothetical protein